MGTVYSIQKTKWDQNVPAEPIKTNELYGRIRVAHAEYEASAEQSDIQMFNLPNGARLISGTVAYDALGASTTISVGYAAHNKADGTAVAAAVAAYKAAATSATAGAVPCLATIALGLHTVTDVDKDGLPVTVSLAGANGTGTIQLTILWVLD